MNCALHSLLDSPTHARRRARPGARSGFRARVLGGVLLWLLAGSAVRAQGEAPPATPGEPPSEASAEAGPALADFIRIRKNDDGKMLALETAITGYVRPDPDGRDARVDLVAAVHIGERAYYQALNDAFERYEALLYELVAPEGTRVERTEGSSDVSSLQLLMADSLELDFQLDHIDYGRENFVHADMSPEEFMASVVRNREDPRKIFLRLLGYSMIARGPSDLSLLMAYLSSDRVMRFRRIMAVQLVEMDFLELVFAGEDGSTLLTHRNRKAIEVLERELATGRRHLGIFYGAGHLPDLEQRLVGLGFERADQRWIRAWSLRSDPAPAATRDAP